MYFDFVDKLHKILFFPPACRILSVVRHTSIIIFTEVVSIRRFRIKPGICIAYRIAPAIANQTISPVQAKNKSPKLSNWGTPGLVLCRIDKSNQSARAPY
jgi:hypothetical protein